MRAIAAAFPVRCPPSGRQICDAGDDEGLCAFFSDKCWQEIAAADLRYHEVGLSLFTDRAFAYYLPAYMIAEVSQPHVMDVSSECIAYAFTHRRRDPAMFTGLQRRAVAAFLLLLAEQNGGRHSPHARLFIEAKSVVRPPNYAFKRTAGTVHRVS
jgi:hypothetical protein